jgi:hypothetical protein
VARRTVSGWSYRRGDVIVDAAVVGHLRWRRDRLIVPLPVASHDFSARLGVQGVATDDLYGANSASTSATCRYNPLPTERPRTAGVS